MDSEFERSLFVGGQLRASGESEQFYRRVSSVLATFLQVKNLSVLVGAGPSYPLGSPRIRGMTKHDLNEMLGRAGETLGNDGTALIDVLLEMHSGKVDLEETLKTLSSAVTVSRAFGGKPVAVGEVTIGADALSETRRVLNRSLALDCDLPRLDRMDSEMAGDPLAAHRVFLTRLLGSRRIDLPRVRLFTTNYDLVLEKALDQLAIPYFDGFSGGVEKAFRPETYAQDLYLPPEGDQRRMLRVPDVVYLYKLHGSITWRTRSLPGGHASEEVVQVHAGAPVSAEDLVVIYPTPQKESDALGYPYSALFRAFSEALAQSDSALLAIGYGFADDHVNRLVLQALGNPSFQLFVVSPHGVLEELSGSVQSDDGLKFVDGPISRLAQTRDARITVLTGAEAGLFASFATESMPEIPDVSAKDLVADTQAQLAHALQRQQEVSDGH